MLSQGTLALLDPSDRLLEEARVSFSCLHIHNTPQHRHSQAHAITPPLRIHHPPCAQPPARPRLGRRGSIKRSNRPPKRYVSKWRRGGGRVLRVLVHALCLLLCCAVYPKLSAHESKGVFLLHLPIIQLATRSPPAGGTPSRRGDGHVSSCSLPNSSTLNLPSR